MGGGGGRNRVTDRGQRVTRRQGGRQGKGYREVTVRGCGQKIGKAAAVMAATASGFSTVVDSSNQQCVCLCHDLCVKHCTGSRPLMFCAVKAVINMPHVHINVGHTAAPPRCD